MTATKPSRVKTFETHTCTGRSLSHRARLLCAPAPGARHRVPTGWASHTLLHRCKTRLTLFHPALPLLNSLRSVAGGSCHLNDSSWCACCFLPQSHCSSSFASLFLRKAFTKHHHRLLLVMRYTRCQSVCFLG